MNQLPIGAGFLPSTACQTARGWTKKAALWIESKSLGCEKQNYPYFEWSYPDALFWNNLWYIIWKYMYVYVYTHIFMIYIYIYMEYMFWQSIWHLFWHTIWHSSFDRMLPPRQLCHGLWQLKATRGSSASFAVLAKHETMEIWTMKWSCFLWMFIRY